MRIQQRLVFVSLVTLIASLAACSSPSGPSTMNRGRQASPAQPSTRAQPSLELVPCNVAGLGRSARCGTHEVFEQRSMGRGRKLPLRVVVLPAKPGRRSPPLFVLAGGPGEAASGAGAWIGEGFGPLAEGRDVVLVDQRGAGDSYPLDCKLYSPDDPADALSAFLVPERISACRRDLERIAKLGHYRTLDFVGDLEEIRQALGYGRAHLLGFSYGTMAAQVYLKTYPEAIASMVLVGAVHLGEPSPLHHARDSQAAMEQVLALCAADPDCAKAFPEVEDKLTDLMARLEAAPVQVNLLDPASGRQSLVELDRFTAAQALRFMLYAAPRGRLLPLFIEQASQGNFEPLALQALASRRGLSSLSAGMWLSVTCTEDVALIRPEQIEEATAGTFLGSERVELQRAACALWPKSNLPLDFWVSPESAAPTLVLVGAWDPVTPPSQAEAAVRTLPNSKLVVVPQGAHAPLAGLEGTDCWLDLLEAFVERSSGSVAISSDKSIASLDDSCLADARRPPFILALPDLGETVPMAPELLRAFVGEYRLVEYGLDLSIRVAGDLLEVDIPEDGGITLFRPVGALRFASLDNLLALAFEVDSEGRVVGARAETQSGQLLTVERLDADRDGDF